MGRWQWAQAQTEPLELAQTSFFLSLSLCPQTESPVLPLLPAGQLPHAFCPAPAAQRHPSDLYPPRHVDAVCSAPGGLPVRAVGSCRAALAGQERQQNPQRAHTLAGLCGGESELCDGQGCSASTKSAQKAPSIAS